MKNEGNYSHLWIVELNESTAQTDGSHGVEAHLFQHGAGAIGAVAELAVHCDKYSTWKVEVVYL